MFIVMILQDTKLYYDIPMSYLTYMYFWDIPGFTSCAFSPIPIFPPSIHLLDSQLQSLTVSQPQ